MHVLIQSDPNMIQSDPNLIQSDAQLIQYDPRLIQYDPHLIIKKKCIYIRTDHELITLRITVKIWLCSIKLF